MARPSSGRTIGTSSPCPACQCTIPCPAAGTADLGRRNQRQARLRVVALAQVARRLHEHDLERRPHVGLQQVAAARLATARPTTTCAWTLGSPLYSATSPMSERASTCSRSGIFV